MVAMMSIHHDLREKFIMLSLYLNHYHDVCPEGVLSFAKSDNFRINILKKRNIQSHIIRNERLAFSSRVCQIW
jgi:hypothetical protein